MGTSWSVFPVEETQVMEQQYNRKEEKEGKEGEEEELRSIIGNHLVLVFRFNGENDFELVRQKWLPKDPFV